MDRRRVNGAFVHLLVVLLCFTATASARAEQLAPRFTRVVMVVLENTDFASAIKQPFLTDLAKRGALFTDFHADTHPSQGNYIAMIAGTSFGIKNNAIVNLKQNHLGDLLEAKGLSWKVYAEDYPGNCFTGAKKNGYARKHNPFISFVNVQAYPTRCARIVNSDQFELDIKNGSLPNYSFYVPNLDSSGHDTGVGYADKWLTKTFSKFLNDPQFTKDTLLVITFDENAGGYPNRVYTSMYGPMVKAGVVSAQVTSHIGLLRTIEEEWGLGSLGQEDATISSIRDVWK